MFRQFIKCQILIRSNNYNTITFFHNKFRLKYQPNANLKDKKLYNSLFYCCHLQVMLLLQLKMRRNPTLPTIRQSISAINPTKLKEGVQSYRKIEDKINSHDEEIIKNQKIISNLANQFRMLKEQLQFEQQYNQKYKNTMNKYQEQTSKYLKVIKDQKQMIAKMEHIAKEKEKNLELINKEKTHLKERNQEFALLLEESNRQNKKKDATIKQIQTQLEKAKKEIKQKELQLKQKQVQIKEAFVSDRQIRESKIKKLQKDIQLLNIYLQNSKQQHNGKQKQIQRLHLQLFQAEQKIKSLDKNQIKAKTLVEEIKLVQKENDDLKKKLKQSEDHIKNLDITVKTLQSKANTNTNEKYKQIQQQKKQLSDKLDKFIKQAQQVKRKAQHEIKQRQKLQKRQQDVKDRLTKLQAFYDKLMKSKIQINQQLSKLKSNILCDYCTKPMKNPVTNIPCGHSYCQQCKAGYLKQCKKCSGVKRQAVYRNQLLDEIIQASNLVEKIVILMNS